MLVQVSQPAKYITQLAESPAHALIFGKYCEAFHDNNENAVVLGDEAENPSLLIAHHGGGLMVIGRQASFAAAAQDLLHHRVEQQPPWNIEAMRDPTLAPPGQPALFCNSTPLSFWEALRDAGFVVDPEDHTVAYLWYTTGEPRFAHLISHPCRLGRGDELHQYVRRGINYDPEGTYTLMCLRNGPSFVCEVDSEPVCWSATHLSGTMAMIYTPEEHRRKGYAKSLAAFQIDHMLKRDGLACCHIVSTNTASSELVKNFGFQRAGEALVWRNVTWPAAAAE